MVLRISTVLTVLMCISSAMIIGTPTSALQANGIKSNCLVVGPWRLEEEMTHLGISDSQVHLKTQPNGSTTLEFIPYFPKFDYESDEPQPIVGLAFTAPFSTFPGKFLLSIELTTGPASNDFRVGAQGMKVSKSRKPILIVVPQDSQRTISVEVTTSGKAGRLGVLFATSHKSWLTIDKATLCPI